MPPQVPRADAPRELQRRERQKERAGNDVQQCQRRPRGEARLVRSDQLLVVIEREGEPPLDPHYAARRIEHGHRARDRGRNRDQRQNGNAGRERTLHCALE